MRRIGSLRHPPSLRFGRTPQDDKFSPKHWQMNYNRNMVLNTEDNNINSVGQKVDLQFFAKKAELNKTGQMTKWIKDHDVLVYIHEGEIKAVSNICPHFGGPVGYHKSENGVFTCLWHNWEYSCSDGSCLTNPGLPLRNYAVKVEADDIYVDLLG